MPQPDFPILIAECAFAQYPWVTTPIYDSLGPYMRDEPDWSFKFGRPDDLQPMDPAVGLVSLDNRKRTFEPQYAGDLFNLSPNPSLEVNTTGWSGGTRVSTWSAVDDGFPVPGSWSYYSGAVSRTNNDLSMFAHDAAGTQVAIGAGQRVTVSAYAKVVQAMSSGLAIVLNWYDAGGVSLGNTTQGQATQVLSGVGVGRIFTTFVSPANTASVGIRFIMSSIGTQTGEYYVDGLQIEFPGQTTPGDYLDGSSLNGRWSGTAHNSTSYKGGPYYPNIDMGKKFRVRAVWPRNLAGKNSDFSAGNINDWTDSGSASGYTRSTPSIGGVGGYAFAHQVVWDGVAVNNSISTLSTPRAVSAIAGSAVPNRYIPVIPGALYEVSAIFKKVAGTTNPASGIRVLFFSKRGDQGDPIKGLITEFKTTFQAIPGVTLPGNSFNPDGTGTTRYGGYVQAPPNAVYMLVAFFTHGADTAAQQTGSGGNTVYFTGAIIAPYYVGDNSYATQYPGGGTYYAVYTGFVNDWPIDWQELDSVVQVSLVDGKSRLVTTDLVNQTYPQELAGARFGRVLDAADWPAADRSIDTGNLLVPAIASFYPNAAKHLQDVTDGEGGVWFVDPAGYAVFQNRYRRISAPYTIIAGSLFDAPNSSFYNYKDLKGSYPLLRIKNDVTITRMGPVTNDNGTQDYSAIGTPQNVQDSTSITARGRVGYQQSLILSSDNEAFDRATYLVGRYKTVQITFASITVEPQVDPSRLWQFVLGRFISDRITVQRTPAGVGSVMSKDQHIEAVEHRIGKRTWVTNYTLSDAITDVDSTYWHIGTSQLGATTVLGY